MNWQSTGYSQGDIMRMQEDAIRRVRQMQQRAQSYAKASPSNAPNPPVQQAPAKEGHTPVHTNSLPAAPQKGQPAAVNCQNASPLFSLNLDNDRLLILALLLIMIQEKADMTIILALCYLLF